MYKSENHMYDLILFFPYMDPGDELGQLSLMVDTFTCWAIFEQVFVNIVVLHCGFF